MSSQPPVTLIQTNLCQSVKSKKDKHKQCPKKKKQGSEYCGVHIRTKKVTRFDNTSYITLKVSKIPTPPPAPPAPASAPALKAVKRKAPQDSPKPKAKLIKIKRKDHFTLDEIVKIPPTRLSMAKIVKSVTMLNLQHYIELNQPKDIILTKIKELRLLYVMATTNLDKIIKIQAFFRMQLKHNRYKCVNPEDFLTFEELLDIPSPHFFHFKSPDTNRLYGFNIKSFHQLIIKSDTPQNPYTRCPIPTAVINRVNKYVDYMKERGYEQAEEMIELTEEQKYNNKIMDIFGKLDDLGNITDTRWFTDLNFEQLKDFYIKAEDLWSYRLQMPVAVKERIVIDGLAFAVHTNMVKTFDPAETRKLQHLILNEINKLITEGQTEDDKRIGAMIILTAFTEVVPSAALALPHYVQSNW